MFERKCIFWSWVKSRQLYSVWEDSNVKQTWSSPSNTLKLIKYFAQFYMFDQINWTNSNIIIFAKICMFSTNVWTTKHFNLVKSSLLLQTTFKFEWQLLFKGAFWEGGCSIKFPNIESGVNATTSKLFNNWLEHQKPWVPRCMAAHKIKNHLRVCFRYNLMKWP